MSRFVGGQVVVSPPIHTFPNGDYFYIEMSKKNRRYECAMKFVRPGSVGAVPVVHVQAPTVREAQQRCWEQAVEKCPRLPRPPYLRRGIGTVKPAGKA